VPAGAALFVSCADISGLDDSFAFVRRAILRVTLMQLNCPRLRFRCAHEALAHGRSPLSLPTPSLAFWPENACKKQSVSPARWRRLRLDDRQAVEPAPGLVRRYQC
jgi:hypothetical protein